MKPLTHVLQYMRKYHNYTSRLPVIGKGAFSVVYEDGPDKVIKVSMCNAYREFENFMPMVDPKCPIQLPTVFDVEHLTVLPIRHQTSGDELDLRLTMYRMPRYQPFSLAKASKQAKHHVRLYKKLIDEQFSYCHADVLKGHEWMNTTLTTLHDVCPSFIDLMDQLNNLTRLTDSQFDIYKRTNFGFDSEGNTVLLDPLFDCKFYRLISQ